MPDPNPAPRPVRSLTVRVLRNVLGFVFLLLGIVGVLLPIVQGFPLVVAGLALIDLPIKTRAHHRLMRYGWYRRVNAVHDRWLDRLRLWWQRRRTRGM